MSLRESIKGQKYLTVVLISSKKGQHCGYHSFFGEFLIEEGQDRLRGRLLVGLTGQMIATTVTITDNQLVIQNHNNPFTIEVVGGIAVATNGYLATVIAQNQAILHNLAGDPT